MNIFVCAHTCTCMTMSVCAYMSVCVSVYVCIQRKQTWIKFQTKVISKQIYIIYKLIPREMKSQA